MRKSSPCPEGAPVSLRALEAFCAVVRQESVVQAARDLGVTPSALSHPLRALEGRLGAKLLERSGRPPPARPALRRPLPFREMSCAAFAFRATMAAMTSIPTRRGLILFGAALPATALARPAVLRGTAPPLPLVMLDPGHGGKDPGAVGVSGTYEKHIAFAACGEVHRQLLLGRACRVETTRSRDVFVPLEGRVAYAQRRGAALFVSLHADAVGDSAVRGASVYTLSDTASDAQSAALARRENSADRFGGPAFRDQPPAIANILASLVHTETRLGSARLQRGLVGAFRGDLALLPNPARHAHFMVLRAADIPSVLVEMGFMSNREDEAALRTARHRARVAAAVRGAIEIYLASAAQRARSYG